MKNSNKKCSGVISDPAGKADNTALDEIKISIIDTQSVIILS